MASDYYRHIPPPPSSSCDTMASNHCEQHVLRRPRSTSTNYDVPNPTARNACARSTRPATCQRSTRTLALADASRTVYLHACRPRAAHAAPPATPHVGVRTRLHVVTWRPQAQFGGSAGERKCTRLSAPPVLTSPPTRKPPTRPPTPARLRSSPSAPARTRTRCESAATTTRIPVPSPPVRPLARTTSCAPAGSNTREDVFAPTDDELLRNYLNELRHEHGGRPWQDLGLQYSRGHHVHTW
ncbi:hypothetical protein B0H15DRAFT_957018 [Mycena belliarum]|uniref:Uncharacterized protein n=1 Tax=Mycena belliarum TaxID=1033014 RepID=A0AAD6XIU1_9AGAR|nr:hypothetical protein B0H15DRAFT_957018 [Mycena belliae]